MFKGDLEMILNVKNNFELSASNNKIKSLSSISNDFILYVSSSIMNENYNLVFIFYDANKNIMSSQLKECNSDIDNFKKFKIDERDDFALKEGKYSGFITFFSESNHISTNSFSFQTFPTGESEIQTELKENILLEINNKISYIGDLMNSYLEKVKKLTELNIKIREEIIQEGK